ncbi:MAG: CoA-binding protein [Candidatus Helarchaeota archaeon]|nr:CoA-binding protein [Candidatus Helarchaeota archaeon]
MRQINLHQLFNPNNICVIGASNKQNKVGAQVVTNLIACNYQRDIYPINPNHEKLFGLKAYSNLKEIPGELDLAIITIPNFKVPAVLEECIEQNVKFAVIITAGFGEMAGYDTIGLKLKEEILRLLKKGDIRVVGPNCMGIACTESNLVGEMGFGFPPARRKINASIVSQSGTWGITTLRSGTIHGLGFSKFVSSGNEIDLKFEDYLKYFGIDPDTQIILGFIEGLRKGREFIEVVKKIEKPIILIKGGKTKSGRETAKSHTGSLTGSQELYEAVFTQHGVIEVSTMTELVDMGRAFTQCLSYDPPKFPRGRRVGLMGGGGGFCVLMADQAESEGLVLAPLDPSTIEKLSQLLPPYWPHRNPVDLVASWEVGSYSKVIKILLDDPNIDAVIARPAIGFSLIYDNKDFEEFAKNNPNTALGVSKDIMKSFDFSMVQTIARIAQKSSKPLILPLGFYTAEAPIQYGIVRKFINQGVLVAPSGQAAARILFKLHEYYEYKQKLAEKKSTRS